MARNRVIYQSEALFAGPDIATNTSGVSGAHTSGNIKQIQRVQSCNYSFNIDRQDVNQFGELAAIDRVILSSPTVSLDFQYLVANLVNEKNLGFTMTPTGNAGISCISGFLAKTTDERNYFIKTTAEGTDAVGTLQTVTNQSVIGLGNGFITNYSAEGSVGNFPTASVTIEALNMNMVSAPTGTGGFPLPCVNPTDGSIVSATGVLPVATTNAGTDSVSALRPGDVTVTITETATSDMPSDYFGATITDAKIQSYNFGVDLARTPLEKLGSKFAFSREINFPLEVTCAIEANIGDLTTGNLASTIVSDKSYDIVVKIKHPTGVAIQAAYTLKNAKLVSQDFSSSIGDSKSVSLNWSSQIGGPGQTNIGFFLSGVSV